METRYGFTKRDVNEFKEWINNLIIHREVLYIQQHHTYLPNYSQFSGNNHFGLQNSMKRHHVINNGWSDIGQHFSVFPDGQVLTGRSLERSPACIYGQNANSVCIENIGNFDIGKDHMNDAHREAIIEITAALCRKFEITPSTDNILYHHWFNLSNGERNNGSGNNKSCPGSDFFGGNKVPDCKANFIPLVQAKANNLPSVPKPQVLWLAAVKASNLNVRVGPGTSYKLAPGIKPVKLGSAVKVFKEKGSWLKISGEEQHWVSGRYTVTVNKGKITANVLNIRSGPGVNNPVVGQLIKGQEVMVESEKEEENWYKLLLREQWVSKNYVLVN